MEKRPKYGTIPDTGTYLRISRGMAYRLARSGVWRVVHITPRCVRVDLDSVDEWLSSISEGRKGGW